MPITTASSTGSPSMTVTNISALLPASSTFPELGFTDISIFPSGIPPLPDPKPSTAAAAFTLPLVATKPSIESRTSTDSNNLSLICNTDQLGSKPCINAITPATCGPAMLVPS